MVGCEAGGGDGVDGAEGEHAVGAFFAVWRAEKVGVAEEGVGVCGFSIEAVGRGGVGWHSVVVGEWFVGEEG